ncbi:MAG: 2-hydroxychromene-2-carboxylate isomerase [Deltaproteobacteria bacterium]|nr:2-hydroxychromene-2-carboxylate isomerase [Deltaproteobacteria bacterium]MBW2385247.1 2-hydroxychromene-2-carboxylate isomerase [Deltaproteobacteria bacterium]MBW2695038.1 2-hydroxychromene-2-carboxylate isomerase [Deltaproteobacteria bacterium]
MTRFEFFFDYGSPYSYLADTQIAALAERTGAEVVYRPMLLGGVFKATRNRSPFVEPVEPKRAYFAVELRRWITHLRVPFTHNPHFPINTLLLMRSAVAAEQAGVFAPFHEAVYPAFWCDAQDMGDAQVITRVLEKAGLDAASILRAAGAAPAKDALRITTEAAVARGVFGAPTIFVGDEMFFGNDRLEFVERALGAQAA